MEKAERRNEIHVFFFCPFYSHTCGIWKFRAAAAGLWHSHSNANPSHMCNLCLWQCRILNPLRGQGLNLCSHGHYIKFLTHWAQWGTPQIQISIDCNSNCFSPLDNVHFPPLFSRRFFVFIFRSLNMMCFFGFILFVVHSASWICRFLSFARFRNLFAIFFAYFSSPSFFFFFFFFFFGFHPFLFLIFGVPLLGDCQER